MGVCERKNKDDNEARSANVLLSGFVIFSSFYHFPQHPRITSVLVLCVPKLLCGTVRHF